MIRRWLILVLLSALAMKGWLDAPTTEVTTPFLAPDLKHWFGTDRLGRDMFTRVAVALANTIIDVAPISLASFALSLNFAIIVQTAARYSNKLQSSIELAIGCLQSTPTLLVAFVFASIGSSGTPVAAPLLLGFSLAFAIPFFCAEITKASHLTSIIGAETLGASWWHILRYYIIPRTFPRLSRYAVLDFGSLVSLLSLLSLMGVVSPDQPTIGKLIFDARNDLQTYAWLFAAPFGVLSLLLWALWPRQCGVVGKDA